jgi:hypothetical protein
MKHFKNCDMQMQSGSERVRKEIFKRSTPSKKIVEVVGKMNKRKINWRSY